MAGIEAAVNAADPALATRPPHLMSRRLWIVVALLLLAALLAVGLWQSAKARCFVWTGAVTCRVETLQPSAGQPLVALSFDDGPTPEGVDAIMAALAAEEVHATFFLIGERMERWPGQARRLVVAGHEIGNHSYSHVRMIGHSADFYAAEIARTDALLRAEGVARPHLFRPPFGKKLFGLPLAVDRAGYRMVTWDVEDDTAAFTTPRGYADAILRDARPGSIILMHSMYRHNQVARDALPLVLRGLKAKGFRIVTVGELLATE